MQLGMMQPYFFPYLGYFSLIAATDRWVVFDTAQYIRRGWVNRNRVLSSGRDGWKYVRVPVAHAARNTPIKDIRIDSRQDWQNELLRGLDIYQNRAAPWFDETMTFLEDVLKFQTDSLCDLLVHSLVQTCNLIGIPLQPDVFSQMNLSLPDVSHPGQWALEVARSLQATTYINLPGGREIFAPAAFDAAEIRLQFLTHRLPQYNQRQAEFIPGLSIIDVLMWNGPQETRRMIDEYDIAD
jgi:hypothetical protein